MGNSLPAYCDEVPEYAVKDGQIFINLGGLLLVMPVHIFMEGVARAEAEIAKWHLAELGRTESNVVPLRA
jgi:hypothetical protein